MAVERHEVSRRMLCVASPTPRFFSAQILARRLHVLEHSACGLPLLDRQEGEHMSQGAKCLVAALVLLLSGCAAVGGNTVPPSVDVSGKWAGTWSFHNPTMGSGDVLMNFKQSGADASGDLRVTGPTPAEPTY